jgi:hypothetical protein
MVERFFSYEEAEEMLPRVEQMLRAIQDSRQEAMDAEEFINQARAKVMMSGGMIPDHAALVKRKSDKDKSLEALEAGLQQFQESGVLLKDLDTGLVDFPCLVEDQEVYLCWKIGEPRIGFWHNVEEGFAGRKPVDAKLLETIRRQRPN